MEIVPLTMLWLPIVLSAVIVFVASSIIHMILGYHRSDYKKLPDEAKLLQAMHEAGVVPGDYSFPHPASHKDMGSPEMTEKYKSGPVGTVTVIPSGPPAMGRSLVLWFVFCLVVAFLVAYLAGRTLSPGTPYLQVFRVVATAAFLAFSMAQASESIWWGRSWSTTIKHMFDGLVYGLLSGGVFGWLWPQ